jgi:hypothetical protein
VGQIVQPPATTVGEVESERSVSVVDILNSQHYHSNFSSFQKKYMQISILYVTYQPFLYGSNIRASSEVKTRIKFT